MGKASVDKGKRYERKVADILSRWSGIELVRTPDGTPEDLYADIWPKCMTDNFPLSVECKHVEGWSFDQIMQGAGIWYDWIHQALNQAKQARLSLGAWYEPVLVFTRNRMPDYVALSWDKFAAGLENACGVSMLVEVDHGPDVGIIRYVICELACLLGCMSYHKVCEICASM